MACGILAIGRVPDDHDAADLDEWKPAAKGLQGARRRLVTVQQQEIDWPMPTLRHVPGRAPLHCDAVCNTRIADVTQEGLLDRLRPGRVKDLPVVWDGELVSGCVERVHAMHSAAAGEVPRASKDDRTPAHERADLCGSHTLGRCCRLGKSSPSAPSVSGRFRGSPDARSAWRLTEGPRSRQPDLPRARAGCGAIPLRVSPPSIAPEPAELGRDQHSSGTPATIGP